MRSQIAFVCLVLLQCTESSFFHKDFSSMRGWKVYGDARHGANKTIELISEKYRFSQKTWSICSVWSKRRIYWHKGFEMKLVFRMRVPDATNNGGQGFAMVFQQNRPDAMGDLETKGSRPNTQTLYPAGLGLKELSKSWAMKFDNYPETTDASAKPHISVHEGGDWINPSPATAVTDKLPTFNNGHDHTVKIFYDIEEDQDGPVGIMSVFWTSDFEGQPSWGTLDKPVLVTKVHFDTLNKEPAWLGFTSTTSGIKAQTVDIVAWTYHEIRAVNAQQENCVVCGGIHPRCCNHWEIMRNERDGSQSNSFINDQAKYVGQYPVQSGGGRLVNTPRLWQHQVWDVATFRSTSDKP